MGPDGGNASIVVTTDPGEFVHVELPHGQVLLGMHLEDGLGRGRIGLQSVFLGGEQILLASGPEVPHTRPDGSEYTSGGESGAETTAMWSLSTDGRDFAAPVAGVVVADSAAVESHTTMTWVLDGPPWAFWQRLETAVDANSIVSTWAVAVMEPDFGARHEFVVRGIFDVVHLRNNDVLLAEYSCTDGLGGTTTPNVNELIGWRNGRQVHVVYDSAESVVAEWSTDCRVTLRHQQPGEALYQDTLHGSATIHLIPE